MPDYKAAFEAASLDLSTIMSALGFTSYPGIDPMLRAITDLILAKAEAQALREEVARKDALWQLETDRAIKAERELLEQSLQLVALRARVVVPDRAIRNPHSGKTQAYVVTEHWNEGWNACLDEQARLNGKAVSEGLLRSLLSHDLNEVMAAQSVLSALLGDGKELGDVLVRE